eukprot:TRINITY_DN11669_c0_g2_i1.p1 TRINITY_DN11669_c0_g2~~TRINITY_DN11669_c0_g2_i1.p1  ORF type:complete len:232 (+),score=67.22 TRINITY_DN11669_c0_g2_i1:197-892(+)
MPAQEGTPGDVERRSVFLSKVSKDVKRGNIEDLCKLVGKVVQVREQYDPKTLGFGYLVEFEKETGAKKACLSIAGQAIVGQKIQVEYLGRVIEDRTKEAESQRRALSNDDKLKIENRKQQTAGEQMEALLRAGMEEDEKPITEPCYFCKSMRHRSVHCELYPRSEEDSDFGSSDSTSSYTSSYSSSSSSSRGRKRKRSKKSSKNKRSKSRSKNKSSKSKKSSKKDKKRSRR